MCENCVSVPQANFFSFLFFQQLIGGVNLVMDQQFENIWESVVFVS